jgi:alpha-L-arabinofuranosidase
LYHPWKQSYEHYKGALQGNDFPQFTSLIKGAEAAADWVAYCNLPAGSHPMADLRLKHGYKEPFHVKYWELDNEVSRWFEAKDYAWAAVVYSKAMKAVDPSINIGLVSYGGRWGSPSYKAQLEDMLNIAGQHIDFLADRNDAEDGLDAMLEQLRSYNATHNTQIKYCNTEWLALDFDQNVAVYNNIESNYKPTKSYMFSKWHYGMNVLKNFMSFQRRGGDVLFVNFNNLANTHSQSVIETPKEGAYLTASGLALELLSNSPAAWILEIENYKPTVADEFQVQAAFDKEHKKLVLYVCNRTLEKNDVTFDLSTLSKVFTRAVITTLSANGPLAMNTLQNPEAIKRATKNLKNKEISRDYSIEVNPYTFTHIVLE